MALSQSVASKLLEAFRAGEGVDLVRESVRLVMQDLIEAEATEVVGAGRRPTTVASRAGLEHGVIPHLTGMIVALATAVIIATNGQLGRRGLDAAR